MAGSRVPPQEVLATVDEEHPVVASIGDQQVSGDRRGREETPRRAR
jgi:hypothetical protein